MVSKATYYQRKEDGLCTKCGRSREGSPSQVRCLSCLEKLKSKLPKPRVAEKIKEVVEELKTNTRLDVKNDRECQSCGEPVTFHLLYCQKCLKTTHFSKEDALSRYDSLCWKCGETSLDKLKIISSSIETPLAYKDIELYKRICYRKIPPEEFRASCHRCYWQDSVSYSRDLRLIFDQKGTLGKILEDDDVIDLS